jgi:hypothetical protein
LDVPPVSSQMDRDAASSCPFTFGGGDDNIRLAIGRINQVGIPSLPKRRDMIDIYS